MEQAGQADDSCDPNKTRDVATSAGNTHITEIRDASETSETTQIEIIDTEVTGAAPQPHDEGESTETPQIGVVLGRNETMQVQDDVDSGVVASIGSSNVTEGTKITQIHETTTGCDTTEMHHATESSMNAQIGDTSNVSEGTNITQIHEMTTGRDTTHMHHATESSMNAQIGDTEESNGTTHFFDAIQGSEKMQIHKTTTNCVGTQIHDVESMKDTQIGDTEEGDATVPGHGVTKECETDVHKETNDTLLDTQIGDTSGRLKTTGDQEFEESRTEHRDESLSTVSKASSSLVPSALTSTTTDKPPKPGPVATGIHKFLQLVNILTTNPEKCKSWLQQQEVQKQKLGNKYKEPIIYTTVKQIALNQSGMRESSIPKVQNSLDLLNILYLNPKKCNNWLKRQDASRKKHGCNYNEPKIYSTVKLINVYQSNYKIAKEPSIVECSGTNENKKNENEKTAGLAMGLATTTNTSKPNAIINKTTSISLKNVTTAKNSNDHLNAENSSVGNVDIIYVIFSPKIQYNQVYTALKKQKKKQNFTGNGYKLPKYNSYGIKLTGNVKPSNWVVKIPLPDSKVKLLRYKPGLPEISALYWLEKELKDIKRKHFNYVEPQYNSIKHINKDYNIKPPTPSGHVHTEIKIPHTGIPFPPPRNFVPPQNMAPTKNFIPHTRNVTPQNIFTTAKTYMPFTENVFPTTASIYSPEVNVYPLPVSFLGSTDLLASNNSAMNVIPPGVDPSQTTAASVGSNNDNLWYEKIPLPTEKMNYESDPEPISIGSLRDPSFDVENCTGRVAFRFKGHDVLYPPNITNRDSLKARKWISRHRTTYAQLREKYIPPGYSKRTLYCKKLNPTKCEMPAVAVVNVKPLESVVQQEIAPASEKQMNPVLNQETPKTKQQIIPTTDTGKTSLPPKEKLSKSSLTNKASQNDSKGIVPKIKMNWKKDESLKKNADPKLAEPVKLTLYGFSREYQLKHGSQPGITGGSQLKLAGVPRDRVNKWFAPSQSSSVSDTKATPAQQPGFLPAFSPVSYPGFPAPVPAPITTQTPMTTQSNVTLTSINPTPVPAPTMNQSKMPICTSYNPPLPTPVMEQRAQGTLSSTYTPPLPTPIHTSQEPYSPTPTVDAPKPERLLGKSKSAFERLGPPMEAKKPKLTINLMYNKNENKEVVREVVEEHVPVYLRQDILSSKDLIVKEYLKIWPWSKPVQVLNECTHSELPSKSNVYKMSTCYSSKSLWFKVIVSGYPPHFKKEDVLDLLLKHVNDGEFIPCFIEFKREECIFLLNRSEEVLTYIQKNRFVIKKDNIKLNFTVCQTNLTLENLKFYKGAVFKMKLNDSYYDLSKSLNLSAFQLQADNSHFMYFPLNAISNQIFIMNVIRTLLPCSSITTLNLSKNRLTSLSSFGLTKHMPSLRILDLSDNFLETVSTLVCLKGIPLYSLSLDGNPLCLNFIQQDHYIDVVKLLFPRLLILDGVKVDSKVEIKKNFSVSQDARELVSLFLEIFFTMTDSNDRLQMETLYSDNAVFSITCRTEMKRNPMYHNLREFYMWCRTLNECINPQDPLEGTIVGGPKIARYFTKWPIVMHDPHSFTVDIMLHTETMTVLKVTGLFKIPAETLCQDEPVTEFSRTFVLATDDGVEYKITNDMMYISAATEERISSAFQVIGLQQKSIDATSLKFDTPPDNETKEQFIDILVHLSGMTRKFSERCLEVKKWNLIKALEHFIALEKLDSTNTLNF